MRTSDGSKGHNLPDSSVYNTPINRQNVSLDPMIKPRQATIFIFLVLLFCSLRTAATSVLPVSLQRMAATADIIFHGKVINNEIKLDPVSNRVATLTTFEVIEVIKGDVGATHTIKQIGGQLPGSKVRQLIHGVPGFSAGQEYVVFLPKVSSLGFASPVGLSQGKFDITRKNGQRLVSNKRALAALSSDSAQQTLDTVPSAIDSGRPDSVKLADFLQAVRGMAGE